MRGRRPIFAASVAAAIVTAYFAGRPSAAQDGDICKGPILVDCPLDGGCALTSSFRKNRLLNGELRDHNGIDLKAGRGASVFAAFSGFVEISAVSTTAGEWMIIRHDLQKADGRPTKIWTVYMHLLTGSRTLPKGRFIQRGQRLGQVDNSGRSFGDHLHFEYKLNDGSRINGLPCLVPVPPGRV